MMQIPIKQTRSPFSRGIGLGSAKEGVEHWWRERVTAVALVPLTLAHSGNDYGAIVAWLRMPAPHS